MVAVEVGAQCQLLTSWGGATYLPWYCKPTGWRLEKVQVAHSSLCAVADSRSCHPLESAAFLTKHSVFWGSPTVIRQKPAAGALDWKKFGRPHHTNCGETPLGLPAEGTYCNVNTKKKKSPQVPTYPAVLALK